MTADASAKDDTRRLLLLLLQGFYWCDESLQNYLRARGWPEVTRPQSMVMVNVVLGLRRPSEIARRLGISRQAVHVTLSQMVELGMLALEEDPASGRSKMVRLTARGEAMRRDAQQAMGFMADSLIERLGQDSLIQTLRTLSADWGQPLDFSPEAVGRAEAV